ncbi:unnamed protein product [Somion occarium]|uniref:Methyltransferase-domain-containing protein n=1 Tax=Somion occarium TaxID=3059160 RepID=A0ABP1EC59_9APHY
MGNPNFPPNLDIRPSILSEGIAKFVFGTHAQANAIRTYGIAGRVWEAAYVLKRYIHGDDQYIFDPPFFSADDFDSRLLLLELGSGTGIIASEIAQHLAGRQDIIVATDLPEVCPLLEKNLLPANDNDTFLTPSVFVHPLAWGDIKHTRDLHQKVFNLHGHLGTNTQLTHIVCSDLVYFPDLLAPLLRSLIHLTSSPFVDSGDPIRSPRLIISYKVRSLSKETPFWSAFGLWFSFEPVLVKQKPSRTSDHANAPDIVDRSEGAREGLEDWHIYGAEVDDDSPTFVFVGHRRPQSASWKIPENDEDLLGGVGAWGTSARKSDDTFESLLLLNVGG